MPTLLPSEAMRPTMLCAVRNGMPVIRTSESASSVAVENPSAEHACILSKLNFAEWRLPSSMRTVLLVQSTALQRWGVTSCRSRL